jgi:hypothetical protein
MEKKRLVGVTVFGIVSLLVSTYLLFFMPIPLYGVPRFIRPLLNFSICIGYIIIVINLLRLKDWARKLYLFFQILCLISASVLLYVFLVLSWGSLDIKSLLVSIVFLLLYGYLIGSMYYFTRPKVKEQFR